MAGAAVATLLFFVHLLALALYGLIVGAYEAFGRPAPWRAPARQLVRDGAVLVLQAAPAGVFWAQLRLGAPERLTDLAWLWTSKPAILVSPFRFAATVGGWDPGMAVFAPCAVSFVCLTRASALDWNRALAATAGVMAAIAVLAPFRVIGITFIDLRFPVAAACLAAAALRTVPRRNRLLTLAGYALGAAMVAQAGFATLAQRACDLRYGELRTALAVLPRGAVLTPVLMLVPRTLPCLA